MTFRIERATEHDLPLILKLIKELAEYEKLAHAVVATEATLRESLFGKRAAEVVIGYAGDEPAGFAVFFQTFSTFLGVPGMYLEDIFVVPTWRRQGLGRRCSRTWRRSPSSAATAAWSGRCSTGTSWRSVLHSRSARGRWTSGPSSADGRFTDGGSAPT